MSTMMQGALRSGAALAILLASSALALSAPAVGGKPAATGGKPAAASGEAGVPASLPGGAQSLSETFEDWRVACGVQKGAKHCVVLQQQLDSKTRQRLLSVELQPKGTGAEGVLVLPFGLLLDKGVTLKVGEAEVAPALRFRTCLPQGCVVVLAFDAKTVALLRKAPAATVGAVAESGQGVSFPVSLKGFADALSRAATLGS